MPTSVYLEIGIGSKAEYEHQLAAYHRACKFISESAAIYGHDPQAAPEALLGTEAIDILGEAYSSDPSRASQGPLRFEPVPPYSAGRLIIELFADLCPKTVDNFVALCTGSKGFCKAAKAKPMHFAANPIHRVVKDFVMQGGDITRGDGSGGESIYGPTFNDEKAGLKIKCDDVGYVGMANSGKNTNSSQFFITLSDDPSKYAKMNGKHVVFGRVVEGVSILRTINELGTVGGTPADSIVIIDSGAL
ncbi:cyclophilin [Polychytrium aggregatum]|uniref:cyclophilin n=1 Tax=Polychytrium aggregatum TaxID=110093 RepID=UPI0022FE1F35|nr:cyclophilin [Polychytrium aggregatum]KAI9201997.1 cyclophilin [Polychytrium aggregatum]